MKQSLVIFTFILIMSMSSLRAMQFTLSDDELDAVQRALFKEESARYIAANKIHRHETFFQWLRPSLYDEKTVSDLEFCISVGIDIHYRNEWGQTPFEYAMSVNARRDVLALLLRHGADCTDILEEAVFTRSFATVKRLVEVGADMQSLVEVADDEWSSGYYTGIKDMVEYIISVEKQAQNSAAKVPKESVSGDVPDVVKDSVSDSANVNGTVSVESADALSAEKELPVVVQPDVVGTQDEVEVIIDSASSASQSQVPIVDSVVIPAQDSLPEVTSPVAQDSISVPTLVDSKPASQIPVSHPQMTSKQQLHQAVPTLFQRMRAHPFVKLAGVGAVVTICYWAYTKYKAHQEDQQLAEQNVQEEDPDDEQALSDEQVVA